MKSSVADDTQEKFETARNECISETKVSRDLADGLKEGKFVEDAKLKEYIFCVNKKIGYQNENGDFDYDVVADDFQQRLAKAKSECLSEVKVDKTLVDGIKEGKFADDSALKEYIFCVNKKIGYQNENGDFQDDEIRKVLKDKYSEELLNRSITTCNKKKDTPQEDGKWQSAQNDTKFKEYMFCFNKKMGYQNEAGDFQKAELKSSLAINSNQENVNDIVEKCAVKKSTPQESAYQCMKCIDDNRPKN
ncbi:PBP GOBP domain containing protein [Asbolus verrucosus]|uniref:PBP GOBP domain containing protein n=1 Tax=Asbolus verrucosus TaxID=1661398 RepID=A0A482WBJ6_ASBVE|nr:PBP GOBP domain containing protein [Asbolus verrucosus]